MAVKAVQIRSRRPSSRRRLAVIVALVCLIGGLLFRILINTGRPIVFIDTLANRELHIANDLQIGIDAYRNDYGSLPPTSTNPVDTSTSEGIAFLTILSGRQEEAENPANPKCIPYLWVNEGKAGKNGLNYGKDGKITGLFDRRGHPYRVYLDTTGKGSVSLPSGRTISGHANIVACDGSDGIPGTWDDIVSGEPHQDPGPLEKLLHRWLP